MPAHPRRALILSFAAALIAAAPARAAAPCTPGARPSGGGYTLEAFEEGLFDHVVRRMHRKPDPALIRRKIRALQAHIIPAHPMKNRAAVLFRLGEAFRSLADLAWSQEQDCLAAKRQDCTAEGEDPRRDYTIAIGYYRRVLREFPDYRRLDEVAYYHGRTAIQTGRRWHDPQLVKEGLAQLESHPSRFPRSRFEPHVLLKLGEHFFATGALPRALAAFERLMRDHPRSQLHPFARHQLAWLRFDLGKPVLAAFTMRALASTGDGHRKFRAVVARDLAYLGSCVGW